MTAMKTLRLIQKKREFAKDAWQKASYPFQELMKTVHDSLMEIEESLSKEIYADYRSTRMEEFSPPIPETHAND